MTKKYQSPVCEEIIIEQEGVLCSSLNYGADTESFDDLGDLEMN